MNIGKPKIELDPTTPGAHPVMDRNDPAIVAAAKAGKCRHCGDSPKSGVCDACGRGACCGHSPRCAVTALS